MPDTGDQAIEKVGEGYTYKINGVSTTDNWIYIECNEEDSVMEYEPFVALVRSIATKWNGQWQEKISSAGDMRYKINNDPLDLVYQWDDLYGIVFAYKDGANFADIKTFIAGNYNIN